jgi:murein DD-endopeptidase MepM/ murein hydrolase activator NlpD
MQNILEYVGFGKFFFIMLSHKKTTMNYKKFIILILILGIPTSGVWAQDSENEDQKDQEQEVELEEASEVEEDEVDEVEPESEEELQLLNEKFLEAKEEVNSSQDDLRKSINQTSYLERKLEHIHDDIYELEEVISDIEDNIDLLSDDIVDTNSKLDDIEETLETTKENIAKLDVEISYSVDQLLFMMELLFFETDEAGFFDNDSLQTIKLLLADEDVDKILEDVENISTLENYMQLTLEKLELDKAELNTLYDEFIDLKQEKEALRDRLKREKAELQIQNIAKNNLLEATKGEQKIYESLIQKSKTEQAILRQEIVSQISKYKEYRSLIEEISGKEELEDDATFLTWPIEPTRGLSATFKDSSYKAALGIDHYAIDIPANSGTSVSAAAPGVVFKVKGGDGNDYHYVLVGHSDGMMTLYGHMYDIFVEEGDTVERGDVIGLSGGAPGTRGAGYLTTGAHLHFELIKDGVNVDPLPYLDPDAL